MKGLIYPLLGLAVIALVALITAGLIIAINDARRARALNAAQWEPFAEINDEGLAVIGVELVARWGRHHKVLRRDKKTDLVDAEDIMARIQAYTRAETRAESYNSTTHWGD